MRYLLTRKQTGVTEEITQDVYDIISKKPFFKTKYDCVEIKETPIPKAVKNILEGNVNELTQKK